MNFEQLIFRKATEKDLVPIVEMLAADVLGSRENPQNSDAYHKAFLEISQDKNNFLAVVEFEKRTIATCHLTIIPSLTIQGSRRMNIEAIMVENKFQNKGIGSWMIKKAIELAKEKEVKIIQLTSSKTRKEAHSFYQRLGFAPTHEGMKLSLI